MDSEGKGRKWEKALPPSLSLSLLLEQRREGQYGNTRRRKGNWTEEEKN
jgi:hypothetical protein